MAESRNALLAKVHIARKDLGLDDETYRAMLEHLTGWRSAAQCTDRQLVMVIASLRKRGWNPAPLPKAGKRPRVDPQRQPQMDKIDALRIETDTTWAYVEGIARRMYKIGLSWCDSAQLQAVITALVRHQQSQQRKARAQGAV